MPKVVGKYGKGNGKGRIFKNFRNSFFLSFFLIYSLLSMVSYFLRDETSDTDSVSFVAPLAEREQKGTWKKMEKK